MNEFILFIKQRFFKKAIILILVLTTLFILSYSFFYKSSIILFNNPNYVIKTFSDKWENGNSTAAVDSFFNNGISYHYTIHQGIDFPYAGLLIYKNDRSFFNLNDYILKSTVIADSDQRLPIRIFNYEEGISIMGIVNTYRLFQHNHTLKQGENTVNVNLNNLTHTPEWWLTLNHKKESDIKSTSKDSIYQIVFYSDPSIELNKERHLTIKNLQLVWDSTPFFILSGLIYSLTFISFIAYAYFRYLQDKKVKITIRYSEDFKYNKSEEDKELLTQIAEYLDKNFSNSELKISDVSSALGFPEYKISDIVNQKTKLGFKAYLNNIRIAYAKEYLKNSEYSISEIAYKCGFNSPSSFNRVFKEITEKSPSEYRISV